MHVVITGASSGIGEALAREFHRAGAKLTLVARRKELLDRLNAELGGGCHVVAHDLANADRATEWLAGAEERHGAVDVLVNNAGMENTGPAASSDPQEGRRLLDLNLVTPLLLSRALLPKMQARKAGAIVQIASVAALAPTPGQSWYGASKAGLAQFSEVLHAEARRAGVHVLTVYPGPVKTPMGDAAYAKFGGRKGLVGLIPEGKPEELARLVRKGLESRQRRLIYPRVYALTALFPGLARWATARFAPMPVDPSGTSGDKAA